MTELNATAKFLLDEIDAFPIDPHREPKEVLCQDYYYQEFIGDAKFVGELPPFQLDDDSIIGNAEDLHMYPFLYEPIALRWLKWRIIDFLETREGGYPSSELWPYDAYQNMGYRFKTLHIKAILLLYFAAELTQGSTNPELEVNYDKEEGDTLVELLLKCIRGKAEWMD